VGLVPYLRLGRAIYYLGDGAGLGIRQQFGEAWNELRIFGG